MRSRTFIYESDNVNVEHLQNIVCKYHIYGNKNNITYGFIHFSSAKASLKAAQKTIHYPVKIPEENTLEIINNIRKMSNCWENGDPPQRARVLVPKKSNELKELCQIITKQNNDIIKKIQTENELLISQNQHLQKINTDLHEIIQKQQQPQQINNIKEKITNYVLYLNTNYKITTTIEDLYILFVFTSEDVKFFEKNGFVNTFVTIFLRIMTTFTIENRVLHFSDENRNNIYIHMADGWIKETPDDSPIFDKILRKFSQYLERKIILEYNDSCAGSHLNNNQIEFLGIINNATGLDMAKSKRGIIKGIAKHLRINE
jgi:hypothetical protein